MFNLEQMITCPSTERSSWHQCRHRCCCHLLGNSCFPRRQFQRGTAGFQKLTDLIQNYPCTLQDCLYVPWLKGPPLSPPQAIVPWTSAGTMQCWPSWIDLELDLFHRWIKHLAFNASCYLSILSSSSLHSEADSNLKLVETCNTGW